MYGYCSCTPNLNVRIATQPNPFIHLHLLHNCRCTNKSPKKWKANNHFNCSLIFIHLVGTISEIILTLLRNQCNQFQYILSLLFALFASHKMSLAHTHTLSDKQTNTQFLLPPKEETKHPIFILYWTKKMNLLVTALVTSCYCSC